MHQERGFTITEVLLSLALLGLIAAAIFTIYYSGVNAWHRSVERLDCQQNARTAMEMIDRELRFADWIEIPQANEIRYRLKGDFGHGKERYYRRFRLQGKQLLIEEIRDGKTHACNVVALEIGMIHFNKDASGNVYVTISAGDARAIILQSSVTPRNLTEPAIP
ncbi:MAG: PilW family protein [Dethiobacteria bacterium]